MIIILCLCQPLVLTVGLICLIAINFTAKFQPSDQWKTIRGIQLPEATTIEKYVEYGLPNLVIGYNMWLWVT